VLLLLRAYQFCDATLDLYTIKAMFSTMKVKE